MTNPLSLNRKSFLFKSLQRLDIQLYVLRGFVPDFERLDWVHEKRPLFSDEGLVKLTLSLIPGTEAKLKKTVSAMGGWDKIVDPNFFVSDEVFSRLEEAGLNRIQFQKTRRYYAGEYHVGRNLE